MADVDINTQNIAPTGIAPTRSSGLNTADTHRVVNDGRVMLWVKNTDASDHTVMIESTLSRGGLALADQAITVTAGAEVFAGPFPPGIYNDSADKLSITFDDATGMELGAFRM